MSAIQQMMLTGGIVYPNNTFLSRIVSIPVFTVSSISPYDFNSVVESVVGLAATPISPYDFNSVTASNVGITMAN